MFFSPLVALPLFGVIWVLLLLLLCWWWWFSGGETPKLVGALLRHLQSLVETTSENNFLSRNLSEPVADARSAVRGIRLIDTSRRGARDLSCLYGAAAETALPERFVHRQAR